MDKLDKLKMDLAGGFFYFLDKLLVPFRWFWSKTFWNKVFIIIIIFAMFDSLRSFVFKSIVYILMIGK